MKSWRADLALIGITVIWGSTFVLVKNALLDVSPILYLALRFGLAAAILAAWYRKALARREGRRSSIRAGVIAGLFLCAGYIFQTTGLQSTTPSKSAFLTGLSIPMVPLAASLVYKKGPRLLEVMGVSIASVGMALMTLEGDGAQVGRGDVLSFLCAVAFAGHLVAVGFYSRRVGYEVLAVTQVGVVAVLSLSSFWWAEASMVRVTGRVVWAVLIGGVLATALAFTVQAWAQQYTTPTRAALIFSLEPVIAWTTSFLIAGERLSTRGTIGAFCILSGILLVELKRGDPLQHPSISAATQDV